MFSSMYSWNLLDAIVLSFLLAHGRSPYGEMGVQIWWVFVLVHRVDREGRDRDGGVGGGLEGGNGCGGKKVSSGRRGIQFSG